MEKKNLFCKNDNLVKSNSVKCHFGNKQHLWNMHAPLKSHKYIKGFQKML